MSVDTTGPIQARRSAESTVSRSVCLQSFMSVFECPYMAICALQDVLNVGRGSSYMSTTIKSVLCLEF